MPPFVARKRSRSASPRREADQEPPAKRKATSKAKHQTKAKKPKKKTLFEEADTKLDSDSLADTKAFLSNIDDEDDDLSDVDSDEFEDVELHKQHKGKGKAKATKATQETDGESEMDWEEVHTHAQDSSTLSTKPPSVSSDLELTLNALPSTSRSTLPTSKKGPSKIERQVRVSTHCLHVMSLLFHNHVRNVWINDEAVQKNVLSSLTPPIQKEIDRWKTACGDLLGEEKAAEHRAEKGKRKEQEKGSKLKTHKGQRDWGDKADHAHEGTPNVSRGDPTVRLLKTLCAFWRKRFTITAPAFRKQGYKDVQRLEDEVKAHRENPVDEDQFGERIKGLKQFREQAKRCQGSRDVGAQLFTALLRAAGLEARLVTNLQPVGFGWSKSEEAKAKKDKGDIDSEGSDEEADAEQAEGDVTAKKASMPPELKKLKKSMRPISPRAQRKTPKRGGSLADPVKLDDESSGLSDVPGSDAESVIDVTPAKSTKPNKRYDRDLPFPSYWTEVLSPISDTWIPVEPIILNTVANTPDLLIAFEPRGAKADRAKQVMAYTLAYSADLTAKDVTVRYLKRHLWPGKTKGVRIGPEKIPIYNKRGKILRTEMYDWFASSMKPYLRHPAKYTTADRIEDSTDLVAIHPVRDTTKSTDEDAPFTLQSLKTSATYVLARHLRREEALLPDATPVKKFTSGKGDKATTEPVYLRTSVVACKTIESWHKEGRQVIPASQPLKHVPIRAVTLIRKREIEEMERDTGEKAKQALYAKHQTEWIIPPPIQNGKIPKNAFGNMDVYVPTMVPQGAVHLPYRGMARVCKKLGVEFAEACTGFEFGNKRAVPILTGVVVANENQDLVVDAWRAEEKEKRRKEVEKREKLALQWWKKMMRGLLVVERVRKEYGDGLVADSHVAEELKKKTRGGKGAGQASQAKSTASKKAESVVDLTSEPEHDGAGVFMPGEGDNEGGGFFPEGMEVELVNNHHAVPDHDDEDGDHGGGGFILEDDSITSTKASTPAGDKLPRKPISLMAMHTTAGVADAADSEDDMDVDDETAPATPVKKPTPRKPRVSTAANGIKKTTKAAAKPKAATAASRAAPRRGSGKVKSHYFVGNSGNEDVQDNEEE